MTSRSRSWACRCGAHFILRFESEPGEAPCEGPQFNCPRCGTGHSVPPIRGERIRPDSVRIVPSCPRSCSRAPRPTPIAELAHFSRISPDERRQRRQVCKAMSCAFQLSPQPRQEIRPDVIVLVDEPKPVGRETVPSRVLHGDTRAAAEIIEHDTRRRSRRQRRSRSSSTIASFRGSARERCTG